jgi:thioredoxin reductase (NADPH)
VARPVIMSVDDDPEVLGAIERDLRQHYRSDYRILKASSGPQALDAARQLKQRGTPIALFLVDERMPEMTGTELLREVRKLHPDARKVLLTAYADTEAAIRGINDVGLDHYLMKPWHPPALRLYPILDDLLSDWTASTRPPYDGVRVAGALWSPQSYAAKEFLSRNGVPYQWVDVEKDASVAELVTSIAGDLTRLPWSARAIMNWPTRSGCRQRPASPSTTSSSWAAVPPGLPPPSTAPPRDCAL